MTLFLTDKNHDSRSHPTVNASDVHLDRKAHATDSISLRAQDSADSGRITTKNDQQVVYDTTVARIIIGRLPDDTYGIAVSKPGIDVNDAF